MNKFIARASTDPEVPYPNRRDIPSNLEQRTEMKLFKTATTAFGVALLGAMLAPTAMADAWNRKSVITFSGPVEIPGVHQKGWRVLPAGTYVFKILDSASDRHIVQIFNKEETQVHATILAIPNYRLKVTDKTVITFRERPAGQPEALRAWFYPGRNWGEEFVYPKAQAIELAKATNTTVLFNEVAAPAEAAEPVRSADPVVVGELKQAPVLAVQPTGEPVQLAQAVTPPPAAEMRVDDAPVAAVAEQQTLPATASSVPLIALFGLLALGGAFAMRAAAKRLS
jgi:hypothetical protein